MLTIMLLKRTSTRMRNAKNRIIPAIENGSDVSRNNASKSVSSPVVAARVLIKDQAGVANAFSTPALLCITDMH